MDVLTFRSLYEQVAAQTDERTDTSTTRDLIKEYLNQAHTHRCLEYSQNFLLWDTPQNITTVVGQRVYPLHQLFDRPLYFYNRSTNRFMRETPNRTLGPDEYNFATTELGPARDFMFWGHTAVKNQPTSASVVTVVSTSAGDTGADYQVIIKGINTADELTTETITLNGVTPAAGSTPFTKILAITKERQFNGTITVTTNSGVVTNLSLGPAEFGRQYRQIYLLNTPSAAETVEYRFYRKPLYLTNDYDIPDIPAPYTQLLVYDALLLFAAYNTDTAEKSIMLWKDMQKKWEQALAAYCADSQTINSRSQYVRSTEDDYFYGSQQEN